MKELTFEEFHHLTMKYEIVFDFHPFYLELYRNEEARMQMAIIRRGKSERRVFYLSDDDRHFDEIDQVYVAYMERVCGIERSDETEPAAT